jgi:hypothetical protein
MSGYTPLLRVAGIQPSSPRDLRLERPEAPFSSRSRGPGAAVASDTSRTGSGASREKTKKIERLHRQLRILTDAGGGSIRPALRAEERTRGKRHQEAAQEDAQAQEEEAAQALAPQAEVARTSTSLGSREPRARGASLRGTRRRDNAEPEPLASQADCSSAGASSSSIDEKREKRPSRRFSGWRRGRNESTGRRRTPSPRSSFCIAPLPGSIIRPRRR